MKNNIFPELDGWDEIERESEIVYKNDAKSRMAAHRLVVSLANLRSIISSQLIYLQDKMDLLQKRADEFNQLFKKLNENIEKADDSSTKLASALNRLTLGGIIVASFGIMLALTQFLFENKIWPFSG